MQKNDNPRFNDASLTASVKNSLYIMTVMQDVDEENGAICSVVEVREGISVRTCDQSSCMDNLRNLVHG